MATDDRPFDDPAWILQERSNMQGVGKDIIELAAIQADEAFVWYVSNPDGSRGPGEVNPDAVEYVLTWMPLEAGW